MIVKTRNEEEFRLPRGPFRSAALGLAGAFLLLPATLPADDGMNPDPKSQEREDDQNDLDGTEERPRFSQHLEVSTHVALIEEDILSGEEVREAEIPDLGTALRSEPGLGAARRGPINLEPQVRGLVEGQLLVLVDGTRTFAAGPARMDSDLSHVGPRSVDTVRVVKGPYALAWGSGALGAIDVATFAPEPSDRSRWGAFGGLSYGSNGDVAEGGATIWGALPGWRYWLGHQQRTGSDYETGAGVEIPGDFESAETRWGVARDFGPGSSLEYRGGHQAQDDIDYPGRILDATFFRHDSHRLQYRWSDLDGGSGLSGWNVSGFANDKRHRMNNDGKPTARPMPGRIPPFGLDVDLPTSSDTLGGRLAFDVAVTEWTLRLGGDYTENQQNAERTIRRRDTGMLLFTDAVWPETEIENGGAYLQATRGFADGLVSATLRLDHNEATAGNPSDFFLENTTGAVDQSEENASFAVSGLWRLSSGVFLTGGVGHVTRYPTALERYADRFPSTRFQVAAEFLGAPDLDPESALQLDVGLAAESDVVTFRLDLYHRSIDDYITVQADPALPRRLPLSPMTVYRYVNGDGAEFSGGEASLVAKPVESWTLSAGLSYLRGDDDTFDEPVFGVPPTTVTLGVRWEPVEPLFVQLDATVTADQDRVATARLEQETPGAEVFDLVAGWRFDRFELRGGVRNLGDEDYSDHLNTLNPFTRERLAEPGRSVFLGVEFSL